MQFTVKMLKALAKRLVMQRLQRHWLTWLSGTEAAAASNEPFCGAARSVGPESWDGSCKPATLGDLGAGNCSE